MSSLSRSRYSPPGSSPSPRPEISLATGAPSLLKRFTGGPYNHDRFHLPVLLYCAQPSSAGRHLPMLLYPAQLAPSKPTVVVCIPHPPCLNCDLIKGPGCSSLNYGAMQELGPFRVHSDGKTLYRNKFAWNIGKGGSIICFTRAAANVLFLESPAGVGFSYSNKTSDYSASGDSKTATDNYVFLLNWLERFPEYKNRDFYIAGESYAGHYVPQLAHNILYNNKRANKTLINLKGIIIGNAVINDETDNKGMYEYYATHALISDETWYAIQKYCNFAPTGTDLASQCTSALIKADDDVSPIDNYNIYAPLCFSSNLTSHPKKTNIMNFDPCGGHYVHAYLNREDVQEALHANVAKLHHEWQSCNDDIQKNWRDSPSTIIPLLQEVMSTGLRLWVYSGDTDAVVPVTSTQRSLSKMSLRTKSPWSPWFLGGEVRRLVCFHDIDPFKLRTLDYPRRGINWLDLLN
ncbi:serine carboxypeptidase-like 40 [Eucalyptus grandis]|uniref:serine carboxypeptidase-like 40 n=1 Tax=Eucalyptus grandis TaxID=71139 RepID=UPI00192ECD2A|nr:serine carboxypeptidase-like 40 [Eucalyptus grandis]